MWLFSHEVRMFFYEMGDTRKTVSKSQKLARGMPFKGKLSLSLIWFSMHYLALKLMSDLPVLNYASSLFVLSATSFVLLVVTTFMLSSALNRCVKALFERGDLDLLLSSPIATQTIFIVRLSAIVFGVLALYVFFLSPVINMGVFLGQTYWLAAYPVLFGMAMLVSAAAMLLTLGLVKLIGIKRTHTVAYLLGALSGAAIFLATQIFSHVDPGSRQQAIASLLSYLYQAHLLSTTSWLWAPARAVFGEGYGALVIFGCGALACWLSARYTHHFFVRGVQQAGNTTVPPSFKPRRAKAMRFHTGLWRVVFVKEWRLLLRDIELLAQICLQLMYMFPLFLVIFKNGVLLPGVVAGLTYLAISLSGSLIWVIVSAEDLPDLLHCAPVLMKQIHYAKLAAAVLPVGLLLSPAVVWLYWRDMRLGLTLMMTCSCGIFCTALLYQWLSKPMTRDRFKRRGQGNIIAVLLETFNAMSWTGVAIGLLAGGKWGWLGVAGVGIVMLLAWMLRVNSG